MSSAICFDLDHSKILSSGNGLNEHGTVIWKNLMSLKTPASTLTDTSILYTGGYTDGRTRGQTG